MDAEIVILLDPDALAHEAARRFVALAREAAGSRGRFSVALSGGSTPGKMYRPLAEEPYRDQIPWEDVHLFWGDERCVSSGEDTNFSLADEALISRVPVPPENVHLVRGDLAPEGAARAYDLEVQDFFCGPHARFDLILLGLGEDGHTASLFPGSPALAERKRLVTAATAEYQDRPTQRVTLSLAAINSARQVLFLVSGSAKAPIVQAALERTGEELPAQQVQPVAGRLTWLLDAEAARLMAT